VRVLKDGIEMKSISWQVDGVHRGKEISELPVTYLLWFIGSHQMRRSRWDACRSALSELRNRLADGQEAVEKELIDDLRPRTPSERKAMRSRALSYQVSRSK